MTNDKVHNLPSPWEAVNKAFDELENTFGGSIIDSSEGGDVIMLNDIEEQKTSSPDDLNEEFMVEDLIKKLKDEMDDEGFIIDE